MFVRVAEWLNLKSLQLQNALWLGGALASITASYTLVKTSRDALFLSNLPAQWLPWVYLIVGVFTLGASVLFGRLTQRLTPLQSLVWTAVLSAVTLVLFALAFEVPLFYVPVGFYLWVNAYGLILVSQFWTYTNTVSDPQEAKRIFGIIGGGGIVGGLVGGLLAAWLGPRIPLAWLTALGAAILLLMAVAILLGVRQGAVRRSETAPVEETPPPLTRAPYVRWLALVVLCSVIVTGLLDYQLKVVIQQIYPSAGRLAGFFGRFHIAVGVAAFLFQLIGTRWVLQRLGAGWGAVVLPGGLVITSASAILAPSFATVLANRLWDQVLRFSLNKSAVEMFYFPLQESLKRRAKAVIEAGIERFGDALSGLTILALGVVLGTGPKTLAVTVFVLVLIWLMAWWRVRSGYVRELGRSLRRLALDPQQSSVSLREVSVRKELVRLLESPYERVVLHAIEMLQDGDATRLIVARLPRLLEHAAPAVRIKALDIAADHPSSTLQAQVEPLLRDPDPRVRLRALRTHIAIGDAGALGALEEFLGSPDAEVRGTALAFLVEFAAEGDLERVRARLEEHLRSRRPEDRLMATEALGARPWPSPLHGLLPPLLEDQDPAVRLAALRSAGRSCALDQVPVLLQALSEPHLQAGVREGLAACGENVTGALGDWLRDVRTPIEVRRAIPRVLGDIATPSAVQALYRCRDRTDLPLFYRVLKASNRIRVTAPTLEFPGELVSNDLIHDVRSFLQAEIYMRSFTEGEASAERFLRLVLLERTDQAFNRVFRRLALLYPPAPVFSAYLGLLTANPRVRGNATEYIENVLSPEHRALVMPLLPQAPPDQRRALATQFRFRDLSRRESLEALLGDPDAWLRTCALYVAGRRRERSLRVRIQFNLEAMDARVRETAAWALTALETS